MLFTPLETIPSPRFAQRKVTRFHSGHEFPIPRSADETHLDERVK